jgi:tRNA (mo5U34)-methyltransferase
VSTAVALDAPPGTYPASFGKINFSRRYDGIMGRLRKVFPNGLEGRSVMDCACNCGAYLFWSKEHGAGECFGFDARSHWIDQARFLAEHRVKPSDAMRFEVCNLYDLPTVAPGRFDVTWFNGIFYHLPDPVAGLKLAADITDELLILNTAVMSGHPDGGLVVAHENPDRLLAGMDDLNWFPTGPAVLARILRWLGFAEVRCSVWRTPPNQKPGLDRIEMVAAREEGYLADFDAAAGEGEDRFRHVIATSVPPRSIPSREMVAMPLPNEAAGADERAIAEVERLREAGAGYLAVSAEGLAWIEAHPRFAAWIRSHEAIAAVAGACEVVSLARPREEGGIIGG